MALDSVMNGNVVRLSGKNDYNKFLKVVQLHKKIGGTVPNNLGFFVEEYKKYFNDDDNNQIFGYWENQYLISTIAIAYRENITRGKFWVISSLFSINKHNIFSFNRPEIGLLIKKAFENSEELQYYEYYYVIAEHISSVYERQINRNVYIPLKRYDRITLDVIPKNTLPNCDHLYNKLLGNECKPHNMIVKKRVLKFIYR